MKNVQFDASKSLDRAVRKAINVLSKRSDDRDSIARFAAAERSWKLRGSSGWKLWTRVLEITRPKIVVEKEIVG